MQTKIALHSLSVCIEVQESSSSNAEQCTGLTNSTSHVAPLMVVSVCAASLPLQLPFPSILLPSAAMAFRVVSFLSVLPSAP